VEAIRSVDIRARVQGFITEVPFEEGAAVRTGQVLFVLDPAQYEAELASAEAQLSRTRATAQEAERALGRTVELRRTNTVPQARVDEAQAAFDAARADVLAAEAMVRLAQLNLSYTRIEASIDGQIGRALYTVGALVGPDSGALARIVQLQPLRVVFSVSEGMVVDFRQAQLRAGAAAPDLVFRLRLPSEVAPDTGTVAVRVSFDNPDGLLLPGQFVTMIVAERDPERLPMVPFSAVQRDRAGPYVFVLGENEVVARRRIEIGARLSRGWSVASGLAVGETVIVQGTQRLRDGVPVRAVRQDSNGPPQPGSLSPLEGGR
jgi:membrane fusion protein (multidrug efflux system)